MNDTTQNTNNIKRYFNATLSMFIAIAMFCCGDAGNDKGISNRTTNELKEFQNNGKLNPNLTSHIIKSDKSDKYWSDIIKNNNYDELKEFEEEKCTLTQQEKKTLKEIFCRNNQLLSLISIEKLKKSKLRETNPDLYKLILNNPWWGDEQLAEIFNCNNPKTASKRLNYISQNEDLLTKENLNELKNIFRPVGPITKQLFNNNFCPENIQRVIGNNKIISFRNLNDPLSICLEEMEKGYKPIVEILEHILKHYYKLKFETGEKEDKSEKIKNLSSQTCTKKAQKIELNTKFPVLSNIVGYKGVNQNHLKKAINIIDLILNKSSVPRNYYTWESVGNKIKEIIKHNIYHTVNILQEVKHLPKSILEYIEEVSTNNSSMINTYDTEEKWDDEKFSNIHKINDNLFYSKSPTNNDLYFVFEKVDNKNIDFWLKYKSDQKISIEDNKNGGIVGFANNLDLWANHQWPKSKKDDLWICYTTIRKPNYHASKELEFDANSKAPLVNSYIEMSMGVFTNSDSPISTHMGIHRTAEFEKNKSMGDSRHRGISTLLHEEAARFTRKLYPNVQYMVTCPLKVMRGIMSKKYSNRVIPILWIGDKIQNNKFNQWSQQVKLLKENLITHRKTSSKIIKRIKSEKIIKYLNYINEYLQNYNNNINSNGLFKDLDKYFDTNSETKITNNNNIGLKYKFLKCKVSFYKRGHEINDIIKYICYFKDFAMIYKLNKSFLQEVLNKYSFDDLNQVDLDKESEYIEKLCDIFECERDITNIFTNNSKNECPLSINFDKNLLQVASLKEGNKQYTMPEYFLNHSDIYKDSFNNRPLTVLNIKQLVNQ